jgi:hypothetical protein
MSAVLPTLIVLFMLATLGVLAVGLGGFFKGGEFNRRYGNRLMRARVALQGMTLVLLAIYFLGHS